MQDELIQQTTQPEQVEQTTCCIVGGGPAGTMLALMLVRKGIPVLLLEEHMDFDRDFRGDTIHPSVMQIMEELGLAERVLELPHTKLHNLLAQTSDGPVALVDFRSLKTRYPYITMLPQVDFLNFITTEAKKYPSFQLVMGARVEKLIEEDGEVRGVHYRGQDGWHEVRALLTVAADGRFSRVRRLAGLEPIKTSPPMDVLWFRIPRQPGDPTDAQGRFSGGHILILLNRFDYWQVGYIIPKGGYQQVRAQGLEQLRQTVVDVVPELAESVKHLQEWKQVSVLSVESSCLPRWYKPGLLLIGDAAHVMSPVAGVGINYAIQDAVVAANELTSPLKAGTVRPGDLARVQRKRELPTRVIQTFQSVIQRQVLAVLLQSNQQLSIPPFVRFMLRLPIVRNLPAGLVAFGLWPAHVKG